MAVLQATSITGGLTMHGMAAGFVKLNASGAVTMDTNTYATESSLSSYLPLSGGTINGNLTMSGAGSSTSIIFGEGTKRINVEGYWMMFKGHENEGFRWQTAGQDGVTYTTRMQLTSSALTVNGNTVWHAGNLTNLNQLSNGPGYITQTNALQPIYNNSGAFNLNTSGQHAWVRYSEGAWVNSPVSGNYSHVLSFNLAPDNRTVQVYFGDVPGYLWWRPFQGNSVIHPWERILTSNNYNSWAPTLTGGGASGTWGIDVTGNSATTSQRSFSGDISTGGMGRFTGWYNGTAATGLATEVGISSGEGYVIVYNRNSGSYGSLNLNAVNIKIDPQGGSATVSGSQIVTNNGGTWGINITGSAGSASSASSVPWTGVSAGIRSNYDLQFRPPDNVGSYGGIAFATAGNSFDAGYFLVRGGPDSDVYTQNGITLVADTGWLTLAQRTRSDRGVRIMTGATSTSRLQIDSSGNIDVGLGAGTVTLYHGGSARFWTGSDGTRTQGWSYFQNTGQGLHWPGNQWHLMPADGSDFRIHSGNSSATALRMETAGTTRGYVYANSSNEIGFLNNSRNWILRMTAGGDAYVGGYLYVNGAGTSSSIFMQDTDEGQREIHCNSNRIGFLTQAGSWGAWLYDGADWEAGSSVRAPIFYDSNDTGYYGDFASLSRINEIGANKMRADTNGDYGTNQGWWSHDPYGYSWGRPHGSFRTLEVSSSGNFSTEPAMFRIHQWGSGAAEFWKPQGTILYLRETPGGGGGWFTRFEVQGRLTVTGISESSTDMRAPIFYDSNDTGYYLDPNGTSNLNTWTADTAARLGRSRYWTNRWAIYGGVNDYMTGTNGWGTSEGTWANAWKGGFSGWDIWGTGTDHPQGGGYIHAQGIVSGQHAASSDGGSAYGWMMVGAADATANRYWLRGKWGSTTSGWVEMITTGNIGSQSVSYASSAGNADTVDGYHATAFPYRSGGSSGYYQVADWMQFNTSAGLYWPSYYNAHVEANTQSSYGSINIRGSKNGWAGINFSDSDNNLMANSNESGFHKGGYGWQFRWENGTLYCHKNSYGGGTSATVWDSVNAARAANSNLMYYQSFTLDANTMDSNSTGFTYSVNAPFTGPIARFSTGGGYDLWLGGNYGGGGNAFYVRTRNGDAGSMNPWRLLITDGNIASQSVSYASSAGNADTTDGYHLNQDVTIGASPTWTTGNFRSEINVGTWGNSSDIYMFDGDEGNRRIHCNSNRIGFLNQSNGWGSWCDDSGNWFSDYSVRAPIFYDSGDTTYYLDPNAGSVLNTVRSLFLANYYDVATDHNYGIYFASGLSSWYGIFREGGAWNWPYPDLRIAFHTGIKIGANAGYQGIRFYSDSDMATIVASINDGDNNMRGYYDIIAYASDRRLKHNVKPIENALSKVISLTGMTYEWNDVGKTYGWEPVKGREAGVFAQEVQEVLPEAVRLAPFDQSHDEEGNMFSKSGENFLTVKYEKLVPLLIEAIKEQQKQIEELKAKLN